MKNKAPQRPIEIRGTFEALYSRLENATSRYHEAHRKLSRLNSLDTYHAKAVGDDLVQWGKTIELLETAINIKSENEGLKCPFKSLLPLPQSF